MKNNKIIIIGGGIIGLSVGWQLARKGKKVEILERDSIGESSFRSGQATWVSAGMLAPQAEMGFEEIELFKLCRKSLELYPAFLGELYEDSGIKVELDKCGCLMVGFDRDDSERLWRLYNFRESVGLPVQWISGSEAREIEPLLSPKCTHSIWIADDAQIDHRSLVMALKQAFLKRGGEIHEGHNAESIVVKDNRVQGVVSQGNELNADTVIACAGSWSKNIGGIPENILPPVRPVKGQIISLRMSGEFVFKRAVRAPDVYLVPKNDGRLLVGASNEEMGFDTSPTAGEIFRLLERAWETVPSIYDLQIMSIDVGLRPGSRDHEPIIGDTEINGLFYATGHYRNGILLSPVTAYELSDWVVRKEPSEVLKRFNISRFYGELV